VPAVGNGVSSLPTWSIWSLVVATVLSPVLAFLTAIVGRDLIGSLMGAGVLALLTLAVAGALGWFLLRVRWPRPRGKGSART
jgi:hypothetical protein